MDIESEDVGKFKKFLITLTWFWKLIKFVEYLGFISFSEFVKTYFN